MAREAELDKVKNEIEKAGRTNIGKTIEKSIDPSGELSKAFDPKAGTAPTSAKRPKGDQPAIGQPEPAQAASAPAASTAPAPVGNGGVAPEARTEAARETPAAAPARRRRRAPARNGAGGAEDAAKPARATAPAETS
jgi:sec-independent protein translocase protein TatB